MAKDNLHHNRLTLTIFSMEERLTGILSLIFFTICFLFSHIQYEISCEGRVQHHLEKCQINANSHALWSKTQSLNNLYTCSLIPYLSHDNMHGLVYDIQLEGRRDTLRLAPIPSFGLDQKQHVIKKIRHFIKHGNNLELSLPNPEPFWFRLGSILMMVFSLYLAIKPPIIQISANKKRQSLKFVKYHLFSFSKKLIDVNLIKMIDVQYKLTKKGRRRYRLAVVLKNRETIPISINYSFWFRPKKKVADKLNKLFEIRPEHHYGKEPTFYTFNRLHILLGLLVIGFLIAIYIESLS